MLEHYDRLPPPDAFTNDKKIFDYMNMVGESVSKRFSWWKLGDLHNPLCAQNTWEVQGKSKNYENTVSVCISEIDEDLSCIYLVLSSEIVGYANDD